MRAKKIVLPILAGLVLVGSASCRGTIVDTTTTPVNTSSPTPSTSVAPKHNGALTDILVSTNNAVTSYVLGEEFSANGLIVNAVYSDNSIETIREGFRVDSSEFNSKIAGTYNIHVIYIEGQIRKTCTYQVTVASLLDSLTVPYLLGINASGMKLDYGINEQLDTTGLVVTATYSDGSEKAITNFTTDYSRFNSKDMGTYMLKFSYSEDYSLNGKKETKLSETFLLATVDGIIAGIQFKSGTTTLEQDTMGPDGTMTSIDTSDWVVEGVFYDATYSTTVTKVIPNDELVITGFNSGSAGVQKVTVSYTHNGTKVTLKQDITVTAIEAPTYTFNASDIAGEARTLTTAEVFDNVIEFGGKCQVKTESTPKTFGDLSFTKRIQTNGKGSSTANYIKFTLDKDCTIAIIGRGSSDSSKPVTAAGFYDENGTAQSKTCAYDTSKILKYKYTLKAGTYYFYDPSYAVQVYGIQIWYTK